MKFLIAGLGSIGRRHLRNLVALGQDDIVLYRTHHSTLPDEELGPFPVETDLAGALKDHPDAVIISNPTALHLSLALPAARMGCHLLMEKPVAEKMDQGVVDLMATVDSMAVKTLVGFQFRFHPVLAEIKDVLATNQMGRPLSFRVHWGEHLPGWHPWEDYRLSYAARKDLGGGVVNTLSHPLDYVRWLFGEVISVTAVTKKVSDLEIDVEDVAEILLEFEDRLVGSIHLDYFQRPPSHWIEINCQKGQIRWENESGAGRMFRIDSDFPQIIHPPQGFERNDLFLDEMRHFLLLLSGKAESRCSLADGVAALKLTEAVHRSSVEEKKVFL
ncbi:MAG: putative oxidoreductase [Anaerolinea thermophila]|uniref:Putative oxidoreductase n=1 Tax=Anaerolinea thermophila TaxID=167964 RepID=A0A101FXC4_9CHLR|nr:MAG: putative oxidoreductase [Anaerolinea thermophila]